MLQQLKTSVAYDHSEATDQYERQFGQHPLELHFMTSDEYGASVYTITTNWRIDPLQPTKSRPEYFSYSVHCHVLDPHFREEDLHEKCGWLDDNPCVAHNPYGITGPRIEEIYQVLLRQGIDKFWGVLAAEHVLHSRKERL